MHCKLYAQFARFPEPYGAMVVGRVFQTPQFHSLNQGCWDGGDGRLDKMVTPWGFGMYSGTRGRYA